MPDLPDLPDPLPNLEHVRELADTMREVIELARALPN
jgi:hypothetical protein